MKKLSNPKLRSELKHQAKRERACAKKSVSEFRSVYEQLEPLAAKLDAAGIEWHAGYKAISIMVSEKNKAAFSAMVESVARALGESPDIEVDSSMYCARFADRRIHVYLFDAEDCKLIEVEETVTRKVKKPHPACVAALSKLEEIA